MKKVVWFILAGLVAFFAVDSQATAADIQVANYSFEENQPEQGDWVYPAGTVPNFIRAIQDWTYTLADGKCKGTLMLSTTHYPAGVPDGFNVAFVNAGAAGSYINQVVQDAALTAGQIYTLQIYAGNRMDRVPGQSYGVQLLAGGNLLAEMHDTIEQPGTFELATLQYTPQAHDPFLSLPLEIKLWSFGGQTNFDQVSLENFTLVPAPLPGSVALVLPGFLGMSALGLRRLRKN